MFELEYCFPLPECSIQEIEGLLLETAKGRLWPTMYTLVDMSQGRLYRIRKPMFKKLSWNDSKLKAIS